MAASRFAQVSDEEISEMKINAVPKVRRMQQNMVLNYSKVSQPSALN